MNPRGGDVRQLTDNSREDEFPDWSPDGRLIAFQGGPLGAPDVSPCAPTAAVRPS